MPHVHGFEKVQDLTGIRIGVYRPYFDDAEPQIVKAAENAVNELVARGAKVVNIEIPHLQVRPAFFVFSTCRVFKHHLYSRLRCWIARTRSPS
jgi:Asp-tRNA(Asn)/Glu-tRNA(Gln) amidotransferase A subunit family amidase